MRISAEQFSAALQAIPRRESHQTEALTAHYNERGRAMTASIFAQHAGYEDYRGTNSFYGALAKHVARGLGVEANLSLLCDFFEPGELTNREWILIMKPEFAEGLRLAGWILPGGEDA